MTSPQPIVEADGIAMNPPETTRASWFAGSVCGKSFLSRATLRNIR